jgi:hypothetical protein
MKSPCEFLVEDIARLVKAEFKRRKKRISDPDLPGKLALIAKMGIIHASHGNPVPSGGTIEVASTKIVASYLSDDDPMLQSLLLLTRIQLRNRVKELCAGQPGG